MILFLALLFLGGLALWRQHYLDNLEEATHSEQSEFRIITSVLTDAIRKKNYEVIDELLKDWGRNASDTVELKLVADNGFVFGQYQRREPAEHSLEFKTSIEYSYNKKATLTAKEDDGLGLCRSGAAWVAIAHRVRTGQRRVGVSPAHRHPPALGSTDPQGPNRGTPRIEYATAGGNKPPQNAGTEPV
ncbi:MAG: hypothetical protein AAB134_01800 [Pseudomonadota bacterium]